jgi:hypothetical protein
MMAFDTRSLRSAGARAETSRSSGMRAVNA